MLLPAEIIKKKRNGSALLDEEISFFIEGYTLGRIPDYQMSALLMAIYFSGMSKSETLQLTRCMLESGRVMDFSKIPGFKVDKHSTGGVGDKTSLILGPVVHALGLKVPMISGRGLGHTGGTLDKLEAIPGFNTQLSLDEFALAIEKKGICYIGQTKEICPADKKIYALRDVTATVESLPLICASILSKKLAEGIDGLVLDVKFGNGAFMKTQEQAVILAQELSAIASGYGKKVCSLITNMNQPLGHYAGNALEVKECLEILQRKLPADPIQLRHYKETEELSLWLSAYMLKLAQPSLTPEAAYSECRKALEDGRAFESFDLLCNIHGGSYQDLPQAHHQKVVHAPQGGWVTEMNTEGLGYAAIILRAGRAKTEDLIEPTSGLEFHCKVGDAIKAGDPLVTLHGQDPRLFEAAEAKVLACFTIEGSPVKPLQLIERVFT